MRTSVGLYMLNKDTLSRAIVKVVVSQAHIRVRGDSVFEEIPNAAEILIDHVHAHRVVEE